MTFYELLGVAKDASDSDIKKAYRRLARKAHPDHGGNHDAMSELAIAYKTLIDPAKRAYYDETGSRQPETPVDLQARDMLIHSFLQISEEWGSVDCFDRLRDYWKGEQASWQAKMEEQERIARVNEDDSKLIEVKFGEENILAAALLSKAQEARDIMRRNAQTQKAIDRVLEMLKAYHYRYEDKRPPKVKVSAMPTNFTVFTSTTR